MAIFQRKIYAKNSFCYLSVFQADTYTQTTQLQPLSKWRDICTLAVCGNRLVCIQQEIN